MDQALLSFNSGEVSPYLRHRIDFEKTGSSCEVLQNFIAQPYGGAIKRPGLQYLVNTLSAGRNSRLLPWVGSDGNRFLLHFTVDKLTVYSVLGSVVATLDFMEDFAWPATFDWENSLRDLQIIQVNDVAFLTHPKLYPVRLSNAGGVWELEYVPFTRPPMLDENLDENLLLSVYSNPRAPNWEATVTYDPGDVVTRAAAEWECLIGHTGSGETMPAGSGDWKPFWTRKLYLPGDEVTLIFNGLAAKEWSGEAPYVFSGEWRTFDPLNVGGLFVQQTNGNIIARCQETHSTLVSSGGTTEIGHVGLSADIFGILAKYGQISPWDENGSSRVAGQLIWHNNHLYLTTDSFTPAANLEPGVGAIWQNVMADRCDLASILHLGTGLGLIRKGQEVVYLGDLYRAKLTHMEDGATKEPGVSPGWQTWWAPIDAPSAWKPKWFYPFYLKDQYAAVGGEVYQAKLNHFALPINKPGSGVDWATYWTKLSAPPAIFDPLHAESAVSPGSYWRVSPEREKVDFQVELGATTETDGTASAFIVVQGPWTFNTYGTWWGTFTLERSLDGGKSWEVQRSWQASGDRNVADSGIEEHPVFLRLRFVKEFGGEDEEDEAAESGPQRGVLVPELPFVTGYALADTYVSSNIMTGVAFTPVLSGRTSRWAEGAFSGYQGFPRSIALHETRLAYAGTARRAVSMWFSKTDDLLNFETGVEATDGLYVTLAITSASAIRWMASQRRLFIGTGWGEWVTGSESLDQPLSPTNFMARQYSGYGSLAMQPLIANDAIFFAERKGNRLREMAYFADRESYDAADLSRLAEHLTAPGISNMAWQQTREPGLWVVRRDGVLLHFAYSRTDRVSAWSRHVTQGGIFRDVVVFPSDDGDDEVFFIVDRGSASMLERFPQHWQEAQETGGTGMSFFHVDGVAGSGVSMTVPVHLRNTPITRVLQPAATPLAIPTVATVTLTGSPVAVDPSSNWQLGFPVVSLLETLPIDVLAQDGTTQGRKKRTHRIKASLYRSRGGEIWNLASGERQPIPNTAAAGVLLRTGWEETVPDSGALTDLQFRLWHDDPFPFCIRAAVLQWELHG